MLLESRLKVALSAISAMVVFLNVNKCASRFWNQFVKAIGHYKTMSLMDVLIIAVTLKYGSTC